MFNGALHMIPPFPPHFSIPVFSLSLAQTALRKQEIRQTCPAAAVIVCFGQPGPCSLPLLFCCHIFLWDIDKEVIGDVIGNSLID